jgi:D-glycerate 3-kinase
VTDSSIDFYLTYPGLKQLAKDYPKNALLQGRGPPGTHDVPLLSQTLTAVRQINTADVQSVDLPSFDKSQNAGFGDRSPTPLPLSGPLDIFILEGWSLGFAPLPLDTVKQLHSNGRTAHKHPFSTLEEINTNLRHFADEINGRFDTHISVSPRSYDYVYKWRLQQEHGMKASNGGKGMSDEEVEKFVDRYMPVYEVYKGTDGGCGGLRLVFGEEREVLEVKEL